MTRLALSLCAALLLSATTHAAPPLGRPTEVKVWVLNFDPIIDTKLKTRLHQECQWTNPRQLAEQHAADVKEVSGGLITFQIVGWEDIDEFPVKADGFAYTAKTYMECWRQNKGWHQPDLADYPKLIAKYNCVERIERGECDEFWWFGAPYMGYGESAMAGRGAFYINGPTYGGSQVACKKAFAIMGFSYERGPAEMIHNLCHRTESTMTRVFGGWQVDKLDTDWAKFAANAKQSNGSAAVGSCHYPPNGKRDYDYDNQTYVESTADDWLNYPNLTGAKKKVNCETWGGPDYQRNYLKWWFAHLPRAAGVNKMTGRVNNWWEYVYRFNEYDASGKPIMPSDPEQERAAAFTVLALGGNLWVSTNRGAVVQVTKPTELPAGDFEVTSVELLYLPVKEADLADLAGLPQLHYLDLRCPEITDGAFAQLDNLPALTWLSLRETRVTDKGLAVVLRFPRLNSLELNKTAIGDAGLALLAKHPSLTELHVNNPSVTDAAVPHLLTIPNLRQLSVGDSSLTDEGFLKLTAAKELNLIWIANTKISDAAVAKFKAAKSGVTIDR